MLFRSLTLQASGGDVRNPDVTPVTDTGLFLDAPEVSSASSFTIVNGRSTSSQKRTWRYRGWAEKEGTYRIPPVKMVVDGREYLDFMCSWGPVIAGHKHPAIDEAARKQAEQGDCMNGPTAKLVELSERLVGMLPHADWAMFQKNGSDATTAALMIARAGSRKRKILLAKGAYHGAVPWCTPSVAGVEVPCRLR